MNSYLKLEQFLRDNSSQYNVALDLAKELLNTSPVQPKDVQAELAHYMAATLVLVETLLVQEKTLAAADAIRKMPAEQAKTLVQAIDLLYGEVAPTSTVKKKAKRTPKGDSMVSGEKVAAFDTMLRTESGSQKQLVTSATDGMPLLLAGVKVNATIRSKQYGKTRQNDAKDAKLLAYEWLDKNFSERNGIAWHVEKLRKQVGLEDSTRKTYLRSWKKDRNK